MVRDHLDIERAIQEHGLTASQVASRMKVSKAAMSQFIYGNPKASTLFFIANAIGCDMRDLFFSD